MRDKRREQTLAWFSEQEVAFVCVDAPRDEHFSIMPSDLDAVTADSWRSCACTAATPTAT